MESGREEGGDMLPRAVQTVPREPCRWLAINFAVSVDCYSEDYSCSLQWTTPPGAKLELWGCGLAPRKPWRVCSRKVLLFSFVLA